MGFCAVLISAASAGPAFGEVYTDAELKVSIPFGKAYDHNRIKVKRVISGDTIQLENGERVRLLGIDCAENDYTADEAAYLNAGKKWERTAQDVERAKQATEFLRGLIKPGDEVRLEFDEQEKDNYGRLLAYVYFREDITVREYKLLHVPGVIYDVYEDGRKYAEWFLNACMIHEGHARPFSIEPNTKHAEFFKSVYDRAQGAGQDAGQAHHETALPDYQALAEGCKSRASVNCCLASVEAMKKGPYALDTGETFEATTCPPGFKPDTLKCIDSYRWCVPR